MLMSFALCAKLFARFLELSIVASLLVAMLISERIRVWIGATLTVVTLAWRLEREWSTEGWNRYVPACRSLGRALSVLLRN
jgi:hypothetical protein